MLSFLFHLLKINNIDEISQVFSQPSQLDFRGGIKYFLEQNQEGNPLIAKPPTVFLKPINNPHHDRCFRRTRKRLALSLHDGKVRRQRIPNYLFNLYGVIRDSGAHG